ncbi:MAG: hypothetical protein ACFFAO_11265 [Candidatus Hermodarchaeota archaeon]
MVHNLNELFKKWEELNNKVGELFGNFDLSSIKELRKQQREIEDEIYKILLDNAPDNIKKLLPEDCGDMEIGYKSDTNTFYYVMFDPEFEDSEITKLLAITIDSDKNVNIIKDFKEDE